MTFHHILVGLKANISYPLFSEIVAAYNLLIHLVFQSPNMHMFLPKLCQTISQPITSSPQNGPGLALAVLTTIFNILSSDNDLRYHVFAAILKVVRQSGSYELLKPRLKNLQVWFAEWESDDEEQRKLLLEIADIAKECSEPEYAYRSSPPLKVCPDKKHRESYRYLLLALHTIPPSESTTPTARSLSIRTLKTALTQPTLFTFHELINLDSVQALRSSDSTIYELLEIFNAEILDEYIDFLDEHDDFLAEQGLDEAILERKMRLLTFASLAAQSHTRSLPYASISKALRIPVEDVEMWVIDVIRAGLVEGKLSQLTSEFLVHRSSYRVFGEKQWREVASGLEKWKDNLRSVLEILRRERESVGREMARETDGGRGGRRGGGRQEMIDVGGD